MRKWFALFCSVMLLCLAAAPALADSLRVVGLDDRTITHEVNERIQITKPLWFDNWCAAYPKTALKITRSLPFRNTQGLCQGLRNSSVPFDVFALSSRDFNVDDIITSGGLADLSDDPELADFVAAMHPLFAEAVRADGGLYAIPYEVAFNSFLSYNATAWALAGYTEADKPTSFASLIDFVERWADRCSTDPAAGIHLASEFGRFTPASYAEWLTRQLVEQRANQCLAEDTPLVYDTPEIVALLERIAAISPVLYEVDNPVPPEGEEPADTYDLLSHVGSIGQLWHMIPSRMTDTDPLLIPVHMSVLCVPANGKNPEAARAFLRLYMGLIHEHVYEDLYATTQWDCDAMLANALLFAGASGDVPSYGYGTLERVQAQVASQEAIVADPSANEKDRAQAQANLERYERNRWLDYAMAQEYQLTADQLSAYQAMIPQLRVVSGYSAIPYTKQTEQLIQQFASGRITAQEFAQRMDAQGQ